MNRQRELIRINNRLDELRARWQIASPSRKRWIEAGADLLKQKRAQLEKEIDR